MLRIIGTMRKLLLVSLLLQAFIVPVKAQQQPHYTQYVINNYILNPAITGIENYTDIKIGYRNQWAGFTDAPVTTYVTIHTPLGKKDDRITATSFDMPGENPRGKSYWQDYTAAAPHHGIGLKIINDRTGPLNNFGIYASYAYHIGVSAQTSIAAGFEAGVRNTNLDRSKLDFGQVNPVDPAVINAGELNTLKPDFGAGIWLYSASYFVGLSAQQIIPQKVYFSGNSVEKTGAALVPHLFATAGYRLFVNEDISALPSIMLKYVKPSPVQADLNLKFQYRDFLWAGAGYRISDGFSGMLGVNVSNTFNISYAYDYTTSAALQPYSRGTHEFVLGFLLGNKYGDWCPRNVW